jgi:hypothetical protein
VFGDPVVATALLDWLLHHAIVVQIEGASYRLREHADLLSRNSLANQRIRTDVDVQISHLGALSEAPLSISDAAKPLLTPS